MRNRLLALLLVVPAYALPACSTVTKAAHKVESGATELVMPPDEERKLGKEVAAEVAKQHKLLENPAVTAYVERVGNRVAATSDKTPFNLTFLVIDDPKTVNAFAIPGGRIYVFTGLLKAAKNEAELAAVMAHEVAHVTHRHVAKRLVRAYGLEALASVALGKDPGMLKQIVASIAIQGTMLQNSRDAEKEADISGIHALSRAGYSPEGMVSFFQTLLNQEGKTPEFLSFLSDHPLTQDRINYLQQLIKTEKLPGTETDAAALQEIQKQIR